MELTPVKTFMQSSGENPYQNVQDTSGLQLRGGQTPVNECDGSSYCSGDLCTKRDSLANPGKRVQIQGLQRNLLSGRNCEKKMTADEFVGVFCGELLREVAITEEQRKLVQDKELDDYLSTLVTRTLECLLEDESGVQTQDENMAGELFQDGVDVFIESLLKRVTEAVRCHNNLGCTLALNDKQQHQALIKVRKTVSKWTGQSLEVFQGHFETTVAWEWVDGLQGSKDSHETIAKTDSEGRVWAGHKLEKSVVLQIQPTQPEKGNRKVSDVSKNIRSMSLENEVLVQDTTKGARQDFPNQQWTAIKFQEFNPALKDDFQNHKDERKRVVGEAKPSRASKNGDEHFLVENKSPRKSIEKGQKCETLLQPDTVHKLDPPVSPQFKADDNPKTIFNRSPKNRTIRAPKIVKAVSSAHRRSSGTKLSNSKSSLEIVGNIGQSRKESPTNLQVNEVCGGTENKDDQPNQTDISNTVENKVAEAAATVNESTGKEGKIKRSISHRVKELLRRFRREDRYENTDASKDNAI